jgi:hypothetical protein
MVKGLVSNGQGKGKEQTKNGQIISMEGEEMGMDGQGGKCPRVKGDGWVK